MGKTSITQGKVLTIYVMYRIFLKPLELIQNALLHAATMRTVVLTDGWGRIK